MSIWTLLATGALSLSAGNFFRPNTINTMNTTRYKMDDLDVAHHLINELEGYGKKSVHPFPYADCRKLISDLSLQEQRHFEEFTANLNTFHMAVSGPISWGAKILGWPQERVIREYAYLQKSFFQRFPQYKTVRRLINKTNTPDLFKEIKVHEKIRKLLLELLPLLIAKN